MILFDEVVLTVDARDLPCPFPVLYAKKGIVKVEIGSLVEILTTDPLSPLDIVAWVRSSSHELVSSQASTTPYRFLVRRMS